MAEISKQALKVDNNQSFPNNNNGAITPSILRAFNTNMIDSMVDEIGYNVDSASWNSSISQLNAFSASAQSLTTGSLLVTASAVSNVITFTKGNGSTFNVTVADTTDLGPLNQFTASAQISLNNLNLWTSSYQPVIVNLQASQSIDNTKFNTIGTQSGSWDNTSLNSYTASNDTKWNTLGALSGSFVTESETGSFARTDVSNTFTQTNIFTSISASSFVSASAFVGDGSKITNITASIALPILDEGIPQGNAFSMNFTGSAISATVVGGTAVVSVNAISTASLNTLTQSFNDYTASTDAKFVAVGASTSSLNSFTASQDTKNSTLATYTASVDSSLTNINQFTASNGNTSLNSYTQSNDTKWSNLAGQTGSYVTAAITASSLVTASVNLNTITFTKGDASTFNITVNTGSGGGGSTDISSLNAFTASQEIKNTTLQSVTSSLNSATQSLFLSASLGLVTASISGVNITFTKGDGSQFTIQTNTGSVASASFADTASFAYTASYAQFAQDIYLNVKNTTGGQLNKGTVVRIIGATGDNALIQTASWTNDANSANTLGFLYENIANDGFGKVITQGTLLGINTDPVLGYTAGQILYLSSSGQYTNVKPPAPYHEVRLGQVLRAQQNNGSMYVLIQNGYELEELHDVDINTGSLANNNLLAYNSATGQWENKTLTEVGATTTSSFNEYTSSTNLFTASVDTKFATLGGLTGSFATTASNVFTGDQTLIDAAGNSVTLSDVSGSLMLVAKTFTSASTHLTSSANSFTNLIFKNNNNTADTIISGSNNLFVNPAAPTAGFKRFVGTTGNIQLNASNVPQISSSMAYPITMNNNIITSNGTTITMRGPVSSSTWTIAGNVIGGTVNIGTAAATHAQSLVAGVNLSQNTIPGTLAVVATQAGVNFNNPANITSNFIVGTVNLNMTGSVIGFQNNIVNDAPTTINNGFYSSSIGLGSISVNRNNFAGQGQTLIVSGALPAGGVGTPSYSDNAMFGGTNTIFCNVSEAPISGGFTLHSAIRNLVVGHQLVITGSSNLSLTDTYGSAFIGRWNANDGVRNKTAQNIFSVGTGKNNTDRKTGFLIDSGSNTFVEGTFNVSGSSSYTGSVCGNVVSMSVTSNTASMDLNLGNYFELTSSASPLRIELSNIKGGQTATLILSASVSSSIAFSSNVGQPSPGAYSGSAAASVDILSFVAFNNSRANLVATKNIV